MKQLGNYRAMALASAALLGLANAAPANAGGVLAGTLIENTASASYEDGNGAAQTIASNTVTIRVDELIDTAISWQDGSAVPIGNGSAVLTFEITNTGNGPEAFTLQASPSVPGNDFDVTIDGIAHDSNANGVYEAGVDPILGAGASTPSMAPDEGLTVFVLVTAPGSVPDGANSQVNLLVQAATGTGPAGTVFAGQGEGGGDAVIGTSGGDADINGALIASIATVTLVKSATVLDPFGGSEAVPGSIITYTITATISGSGAVSNLRVSDTLPTGTSYQPGSLSLDGAALTDANDADAGTADGTSIDVVIGNAAAGSSHAVRFEASIN